MSIKSRTAKSVQIKSVKPVEPEPEDGITGFKGSPERIGAVYNPLDNLDDYSLQ